jgi:hypothetical protein
MTAEEHTTCKRGNGHLQETVVTPPGVVEEHDEQAIGAANNCQLCSTNYNYTLNQNHAISGTIRQFIIV